MRAIHMFVSLVLIASSTILGGCASSSTVSVEESEAAKSFEAPEDRGVVFLYRTGRALGAANAIEVQVNGQAAGGTGPGTFFRWDLKPGTHSFYSRTGESSATVAIDVEAGQVYFIQQDARLGLEQGRVTLREVDAATGQDAIKSMKMLVSAYVPE
jgi:hypothetical protein